MALPSENPTNGPRAKIARAQEHLSNFQAAVVEFLTRNPYGCTYNVNPNGSLDFIMQVKEHPPIRLSTIAGDVIHNARAALDLMACQFVAKGSGRIDDVHFPIFKYAADFHSKGLKDFGKASPQARKFIQRLKPYDGGNQNLFLLHRLDLRDKHRLLVPVGAAAAFANVYPFGIDKKPFLTKEIAESAAIVEDGQKVLTLTGLDALTFHDAEHKQLRFDIRLGGIPGLPQIPARRLLDQIVQHVGRIVAIAESRLF